MKHDAKMFHLFSEIHGKNILEDVSVLYTLVENYTLHTAHTNIINLQKSREHVPDDN